MLEEYKSGGGWAEAYEKWVGQYTGEQQEPPTMTLEEAMDALAGPRLLIRSDPYGRRLHAVRGPQRRVPLGVLGDRAPRGVLVLHRDGGRRFVAALRIAPNKWLQRLGSVETFRNIPLLVLLFISFAGLRRAGVDINAWVAGIASLGLHTAAYVAEALRSGVFSVSKGQIEAALSLGYTYGAALRRVVFPQAFRTVISPLGSLIIAMIKNYRDHRRLDPRARRPARASGSSSRARSRPTRRSSGPPSAT